MRSKSSGVRLCWGMAALLVTQIVRVQAADLDAGAAVDSNSARVTRTFRVNPNIFLADVRTASTESVLNATLQERARAAFAAAGLDFAKGGPPRIFMNGRTGTLIVDGTVAEILLVETVLKELAQRQSMVLIEVRVAEIPADIAKPEVKALVERLFSPDPLNGLLHPLPMGEVRNGRDEGKVRPEVITSVEMHKITKALEIEPGLDLASAPRTATGSGQRCGYRWVQMTSR